MAALAFNLLGQVAILQLLSYERTQRGPDDPKKLNPLVVFGCARLFQKLNQAL